MEKFKIHCSAISSIMAATKGERTIPVGAETVCQLWHKGQYFNRQTIPQGSKHTRKGIHKEEEAIFLYGDFIGDMFLEKNKITLNNEWLIGTPDLVQPLVDIKCPYNAATFPLHDTETKKEYWWQMQGYMDLTGEKSAKVVAVLVNATEDDIEAETYAYAKNNGIEITEELDEWVRSQMTYDDIPIEKRIKVFEVLRDDAAIQLIHERVEACRKYIETLSQ